MNIVVMKGCVGCLFDTTVTVTLVGAEGGATRGVRYRLLGPVA